MSGYLRGSQLQRQLEEKLKETAKTRQAAEESLKAAQDLIDAAKKDDAVVVAAEKAVAEASAAMADKDYKLAAEKAAEAAEKAKGIYRARVSEMIESGTAMAALAKGVGADSAEADAILGKARDSLAAENLPEAVDLVKKAWKRSEKVLSENLSSGFSKAQALLLSAKNLGRDTAPVEDLLSRARTAVEGNNFQSALDFTREALETITEDLTAALDKDLHEAEDLVRTAQELGADVTKPTNLLERARADMGHLEFEKANNSLRQSKAESEKALQKSLEGKIANFSKFIDEAKALGADPAQAQAHFAGAEGAIKRGDFRAAAQLAKQGFQALQDAQFQRVVATIAASREKFVVAVNMGVDLKEAIADLNNARGALQRNAFQEAIGWARKADDLVEASVGRLRKIQDRLRELHRDFAEAEGRGVSTAPARKAAERARDAYQRHDLDAMEVEIDAARDELRRAEREHVLRAIESAESLIALGERGGVRLEDASKILQDAIVATKANEARRGLDLVSQAQARAEDLLRKHVAERIAVLKNALAHLGAEGEPLQAVIARAEGTAASHDFEGALRSLEEGRALVEERSRHRADELVESLGTAAQLGVDLGANVAEAQALYADLNGALGRGNVADVLAAQDRVVSTLATASEGLANFTKARIATAQSLKIDVAEMSVFYQRARMALASGNYREGLAQLKESADRASKATAMHRQAYTALSSAAAIVAEAKKHNVDVSKVVETLVDAKKAFERLDYAQAMDLATRARAETERLTVLYSSAQKILVNRERMELADRLGIEAPHLRDMASQAKEAMKAKDYDNALRLASKSEEEFASLIREKVATVLTSVGSLAGTVEGVNLATVNDSTIRARQALDAGELSQAADLALSVRDGLEKLKKQSEEARGALQRVREIVADAEAMNLETPTTAGLLDKADRAFTMGRFEETLDFVSQAEASIVPERDRGVATMMRRFEESIEKAKRDGADTRSAEKMYERSREFFRARKYRQALAAAVQSEAEAERVALQQGMASQAVEAIERKLKALGHAAPTVESVTDEAREALVKGDYVKALDTAIRATDALADFRSAFEETQEVRVRAQALRATAREIGVEAENLDAYLRDGDISLDAGNLAAARAAFQRCLEWGVDRVRKHLAAELEAANRMAELAKKFELDPTPILNRLSEARTQIDSENFALAAVRIKEGRELAQQALGGKLNRAIQDAADNVAHAKKLGTDAREAEALLQDAQERIARGEYESALDTANRALERVESVKVVEKRFADLTYKADTTIRNGKKFGIDMRLPERKLAESLELRKRDFTAAIKVAEEAYRLAWDSVEAFAPNLKGALTVGPAQLNVWADATLELENVGKGLAKDVKVRVLGDAETEGLADLAAVRAKAKETLTFRIKMTAPGSVPLAIQIVSHRVFDEKEYTQEMIAQVEVAETAAEKAKKLVASLESRCPICKGTIKSGFKVVQCACGRDFHELCATRVGRCPVCFRSLGNAE